MTNNTMENSHRSKQMGGKILPAICNVLGWMIIVGIILLYIPVTVPKLMGYDIYNVVSGSMEPELPVGSAVYTTRVSPDILNRGDIIAFASNSMIITHRIVDKDVEARTFVTKGDANATEDLTPIAYNAVIGKVVFHVPYLGMLYEFFTSPVGKYYVLAIIAAGAVLTLIARALRKPVK